MSQGIFTNNTSSVFNKKKKTEPVSYGPISIVQKPQVTNKTPQANFLNRTPTTQKPATTSWDSQYRNNASYAPAPTYKPQPQADTTQENPTFDYYKTYMDSINKQNQNLQQKNTMQEQLARTENDTYQKQLERMYGQTQNDLKSQIPVLQQRSQSAQDLIQKGLESVKTQGGIAKTNIIDQAGTTLRGQAQSKREVDAKRNAVFAGNNTTDSFGFGGYQMEQSNADTDFLREQNITKRAKDQQLAQVDMQITSAEATAQKAVSDEVAKFEDAVRQINSSMNMNTIEKQNAVENSYNTLQKTLFGIRDSYNTTTAGLYEKQLELMKAVTDAEATGSKVGTDKLSAEFIYSGFKTPKTPEDYLYMQTKGIGAGNASQVKSDIIGLVDEVLNKGVGDITGWDAFRGNYPSTPFNPDSLDKKQKVEQIKNMLNVEAREKLRGQGQITEGEQAMLSKSVTALNYGMSETAFNDELKKIKTVLARGGGQSNMTQQVRMTSPDGQSYTVDQSEVQEAIQNGWRAN